MASCYCSGRSRVRLHPQRGTPVCTIHVHVFLVPFFDFVFRLNKPVACGAASWSSPAACDCMRAGGRGMRALQRGSLGRAHAVPLSGLHCVSVCHFAWRGLQAGRDPLAGFRRPWKNHNHGRPAHSWFWLRGNCAIFSNGVGFC